MKKTYEKPELLTYQVYDTPLMEASYGSGYADSSESVLSKRHGYGDFTDDDDNLGDGLDQE